MDSEQQTTNVSLDQTIKHAHTPLSLKVKAVLSGCLSVALMFCVGTIIICIQYGHEAACCPNWSILVILS